MQHTIERPIPAAASIGAAAAAQEQVKLSVRNLNFYYGKFHALKNINLTIPAGKVTAFIGPSGCGKSTLLQIVAGLLAPSAGEVLFLSLIHI